MLKYKGYKGYKGGSGQSAMESRNLKNIEHNRMINQNGGATAYLNLPFQTTGGSEPDPSAQTATNLANISAQQKVNAGSDGNVGQPVPAKVGGSKRKSKKGKSKKGRTKKGRTRRNKKSRKSRSRK
jgi:hypothetical protein